MKKVMVLLFVIGLGAAVFAQNAERDFQTDGKGTITKYVGTVKAVVIPAQIGGKPVTAIGYSAFQGKNLTSVTIPNSVTTIRDSAFANNKLTSVTIPDSVTSIKYGAFQNNKLTSVTIPDSVTIIETSTFSGNQLTSVVIGKGVISIQGHGQDGSSPFAGSQLTSVTIGPNLVSGSEELGTNFFIDYMANSRKAGTYQIDTKTRTEKRDGDFGYIETKYGAYLNKYYGSQGNSLMIPEKLNGLTVTAIGNEAFRENQLTSVTIPDSITSIGYGAFAGNQLTSVIIPDSVTIIEGIAFWVWDIQLTSVTIPANVSLGTMGPIENFDAFPNNFDSYYYNNGKKAGTYEYRSGAWSMK